MTPKALLYKDRFLGNFDTLLLISSNCLYYRHVQGKKVLVVTNNTVAPLYLDKVTDALTRGNPNVSVENVILPDGENYKNMVGSLLRFWLSFHCCITLLVAMN